MKKKLFVIALCVCVIAAIACGSLAYFTSNDTKTNKFMTAAYDPSDEEPTADEIFSVKVIEDATKDPSNPKSIGGTPNEDDGYDYKDILPGSEAAKKVTVENTGKYGEYVRVKVTVSKAAEWKEFFGDVNLAEKLCNIDKGNWELAATTPDTDNDTVTYTYNYSKSGVGTVLAAGQPTSALFTKVTIPAEDFDAEDFVKVDGFTVSVLAEAIQSDYTGTISEAFALFEAQNK